MPQYTPEERAAVEEGMRRFGEGQWVAIKRAYPRELARLNNVRGLDALLGLLVLAW